MNYAFLIRLQDLMSGPLARISQTYSSSVSRWEGLTRRFESGFQKASQSVEQLKSKLMMGRQVQSVDQLRIKLDSLEKRRNISINSSEIKRLNREITDTEKRLNKLQGRGTGGGSGGMLAGLAGGMGLGAGATGMLTGAALIGGAGWLAKQGMDREQTKVAFEQFVGKAGVDPLMGKLNQFADVTPYSNEDVYGSARTLLSAGVKQEQLTPAMTNIGNMAAVSQKDFGELTQAYAKIKQKGFVDGGELHQEFGGTAIMDQLKKNLGVNGEELFKLAEKRQIKFADLEKAVADLSKQGGLYEGGLDKLSKTAGGKWSTFLGTLSNKAATFAESLNPILSALIDIGMGIINAFSPVFDALGNVMKAFSPLFSALTSVLGLFGLAGGQAGLLTWIMQGLATVINGVAWVINLLATGIQFLVDNFVALAGGIAYAWEHVDGFRHAVIRCWETVKAMFSAVGPVLQALFAPTPANIAAAIAAVKKGWSEGTANGNAAVKADQAARAAAKATKVPKVPAQPATGNLPGAGGGADGKGKEGGVGKAAGLDATTAGAKSTNITINLKNLVEHLTIHASGVQEGMASMEEQVADHMLRVLNSANAVAS